jgi:hypothetical protein
MRQRFVYVLLILNLVCLGTPLAHAQGSAASSLAGKVVDPSGAAVPGATVVAKHNGTGTSYNTVTSAAGTFSIPAMNIGTYTVTITMPSFKTVVLNDVVLNAAVPASVRATLEVGGLQEAVEVSGAGDIVQTQATAVSTTIEVNQIMKVPVTSRSAMDFLTVLPGVSTPGGNRDSTITGLPQSTINITLDGVNIQDNTLKTTDGFFSIVSPRLDAIEEVTLTSAGQGADAGGQGAAQIRFVTRSGTNQLHGSIYNYFRHDSLNSNTFFNNRDGVAKPKLKRNQPGFRIGGPIVIPGLFDGHDKAHFFINYEEERQPSDTTRDRIILSPRAQQGFFRYNTAAGQQEINLLELAGRNGQTSTLDPTVTKLLADIRSATGTTGSVTDLTDPLVQRYSFNVPQKSHNRFPTVRLDFDISKNHHLMTSMNYNKFATTPDTLNNRDVSFPGFPVTASQTSERLQLTGSLRSTLGPSLVNEFRVGGSGAPVQFFSELSPEMWNGSVANQQGFHLNLNGACCGAGVNLQNAGNTPTPSSRNASTKLLENTLNWIKGSHRWSFGASFTQVDLWLQNQNLVPQINFAIEASDPASAMFTTANFPGASAANLSAAQGLYNILTGRVSSITANAGLNEDSGQYEYLGKRMQRGRMRELDFFVQDSWQVRSNLTVNYGLRYSLQLPFNALNSSYTTGTVASLFGASGEPANCDLSNAKPEQCNLFQPGVRGGPPEFIQLKEGVSAYETDWNNFAPNLAVAWRPNVESGFLRKLLGPEGDSVLRASFSRNYIRHGLADFTNRFGANPGVLITTDRSTTLNNLGTLPVLLREQNRLGAPTFETTPKYPMTDVITQDINMIDPKLKVPYADSWTVGFQRALGKNMRLDLRYVGSRSKGNWYDYNYNEVNIIENGMLNEFKLAQGNLQANIAAGRGNTFRYFGPGTGTSPLPITLAYFAGLPASAAGDPNNYGSALFTNATFVTPLARMMPNPMSYAFNLYGGNRHTNALRAGLPSNFFIANPDLQGGAIATGNGPGSHFHGFAIEVYRRFTRGFQFQASYEYGIPYGEERYSFRRSGFVPTVDSGGEGGVEHSVKGTWVWELPVGKGRRFAGGSGGLLDAIIGGWNFSGTAFFNNGRMVDFGNVRMVGFDEKELKKMYKLRALRLGTNERLYMLPQDVIENSVKAFSVSATSPTGYGTLGAPSGRYFAPANGPDCIETTAINNTPNANNNGGIGDCGVRSLIVDGPGLMRFNLGIEKQFPLPGKFTFLFRAEMLNALNTPYFTPVTGMNVANNAFVNVGANTDNYEVTNADSGRTVQLVARITW